MKRTVIALALLVAAQLFFLAGCNQLPETYAITGGEATVVYSSHRDATFLYARCWLLSRNDAHAGITGWRITYRSGKKKLLEVNDANYLAYAPYVIFWDIYAYDKGSFTLQCHEPGDMANAHPYPGRLFPAALPDNLDIRLTLTDADGTTENVERNIEVMFSSVP